MKNSHWFSGLLLIVWVLTGGMSAAGARFAVLADVHVSPGNVNERRLAEAVREINAGAFDFVLVPGDLTNQGTEAELDAVGNVLRQLTVPFFAVPGNHETNWSPTAGQGWIRRYGSERVNARIGDCRVVGFSTGPYMKMGDGFVRSDDLSWLKQTLASCAGEEVVLMAHYPLTEGVGNWADLQRILQKHPVAVVIGGHWHRIRLFNYHGIPGILSRALSRGKTVGYGIVELTPDMVVYQEKVLGELPREVFRLERERSENWPDAIALPPEAPSPSGAAREVWRDSATVYTGVAVLGDAMFYGTSDGKVKAVDFRKGQLLWETSVGGQVYSTPACADGVVALGCVNNRVVGLNAADGSLRWTVDTDSPVSADGIMAGGRFFIGDSSGNFYGIDGKSGRILFCKKVADARFQARPLVADAVIYAPAWDGYLYALDAKNGEVVWKWTHGKPNRLFSPGNSTPLLSCGRIFIATPDRYLNAIDAKTGKTLFRSNECLYRESIGLSGDGRIVYGKTMKGELALMAAASPDGKVEQLIALGWTGEHNPCPVLEQGGLVYLGSRDGKVARVTAVPPYEVRQEAVGTSAVNRFTPLPDGGVLFTVIDGRIFLFKP